MIACTIFYPINDRSNRKLKLSKNCCILYKPLRLFESQMRLSQFFVISYVSKRAIQIYKLIDLSASRLFTLTKMNFVQRKLECLDLIVS
jgi:hypothetical protein